MRNLIVTICIFLLTNTISNAQDKKFKVQTVAFYNVENLFDTKNDPKINDEEWLPDGAQRWTPAKYQQKLTNIAKVISEIGVGENNPNSPVIIGLGEIENRGVLEDLVKQPALINKDYGIIHFDSPDKRGIDVAMLYQKKHFKPTSYKNIPLIIRLNADKEDKEKDNEKTDDDNQADAATYRLYTRDQLLVTGLLDGEEFSFIVNHWPSRSGGEKKSSPNREAAAALNRKIIDSLYKINPETKLITMGDLNDGPYNNSIKKVLGAKGKKEDVQKQGLFNPMEDMSKRGIGTLAYRDAWDLFDQMIITEPLVRKDYTSYRFWKANVFNKSYLAQTSGQYKGYPLRNWNGEVGYSDHFPVYMYLIKQM